MDTKQIVKKLSEKTNLKSGTSQGVKYVVMEDLYSKDINSFIPEGRSRWSEDSLPSSIPSIAFF